MHVAATIVSTDNLKFFGRSGFTVALTKKSSLPAADRPNLGFGSGALGEEEEEGGGIV